MCKKSFFSTKKSLRAWQVVFRVRGNPFQEANSDGDDRCIFEAFGAALADWAGSTCCPLKNCRRRNNRKRNINNNKRKQKNLLENRLCPNKGLFLGKTFPRAHLLSFLPPPSLLLALCNRKVDHAIQCTEGSANSNRCLVPMRFKGCSLPSISTLKPFAVIFFTAS